MKENDLLRDIAQHALLKCDILEYGIRTHRVKIQELLREADQMRAEDKYDVESDLQKVYCDLYKISIEASMQMEDAIKKEYSPEHIAYLEGVISGLERASSIVKTRNKKKK